MVRPAALLLVVLAACSHGPARTVAEDRATTSLIDAELVKTWDSAQITPAPPASDAEFVRRATLDLAGRVPTLEETRAYLASKSPEKRAELVDRLLAGTDFARHWTDVFLALLVGRDQKQGPGRQILEPWLQASFSEGKPYDSLVRELLTATGTLGDVPQGAFLARQGRVGGPEAAANKVAEVFLGLQIGCAQCHDHPTDSRWKQRDFYGLVGFFARTKERRGKGEGPLGIELADVRRGEAQMVVHATGATVTVPPAFLGREIVPRAGESRREALAREVVHSDLFAKEAVNRTWALLFGRGLVDPVDDLGAEHDSHHPPLLSHLAEDFAAHGYDLRRLLRAICLSDAYGRASTGGAGPDLERNFARAAVRPMQPEQLFRTLLAATGAGEVLEERLGEEAAEKKLEQGLKQYLFVFGDDEMAEVDRFQGNVPQALALLNGDLVNLGVRAGAGGTLTKVLAASKDRGERVNQLFLAAYARPPSEPERASALKFVDDHLGAKDAYEDLFHALLTSAEATLVH